MKVAWGKDWGVEDARRIDDVTCDVDGWLSHDQKFLPRNWFAAVTLSLSL